LPPHVTFIIPCVELLALNVTVSGEIVSVEQFPIADELLGGGLIVAVGTR